MNDERDIAGHLGRKAILDRHVAMLMEHFDSVTIIVTNRSDEGGTSAGWRGDGNWYARYGSAVEYLRECRRQMARP